ncbi:hypothetical protein A3J43_02150 [Candidatus Uhrbacteria bacterium RIFCSPHIGHO2_12_FULL_54_23]|uniref:Kinase inhibitor n=3 Tax=Candidatus Uhriibacteriota TaxID=1752732 RepID=A0A1F7ULX4_9BACT|nr:MAG: hypothetical protein A3J43_02150 [Candidatus Uhrbacteria bacterium RIFCSPHIGHO2_12_FULL_54_23]OGL84411.1 MAG: hypothetical protein A3B36_02835 [Candidatus Uhrbacteria bacterium RIFCSPLOWO2_01_FULL_55_36]OGL90460.1 MAG: hypothetical protein A3J36_00790 [Candidatus Uhrbacteria bacterium RIFCSPLOWO2_02_FULL_54_37]
MELRSSAFVHHAAIPRRYTCDGEDVNPPLEFSGVPEGALSLAFIVDDPDAPAGIWVHWTLWNIAPDTRSIPEHSVPAGAVEGTTSFGKTGWGGPCPPSGEHRYFFKLYALDAVLDLSSSADKAALEQAMTNHTLAQAELIGLYRITRNSTGRMRQSPLPWRGGREADGVGGAVIRTPTCPVLASFPQAA